MKISRSCLLPCLMLLLALGTTALAEPPLCTTHFFDWYVVNEQNPLEQLQKRWTYQVDWDALGIAPEEIGNSVHYYEVQFRKILDAGFDGVHYEWHNNQPKPPFIEAAQKVKLPLAMFYDMQIRFHTRPAFIKPTKEFAAEAIADVVGFYQRVPKNLWLHDRNGHLPIIVYGYAFDQSITDPKIWHTFYQTLIDGVEQGLSESVVFHWTNTQTPQQMYGFQHFPEIQSYIFNEAMGQTQVDARSVTFVVHYDDLGVSFPRQGPRERRWIRNDVRYLQEALWLAKHTDPDLFFNYGWNELYEGEHLLPDERWGSWRYEVASAMVQAVKTETKSDLPRALIVADDFLTEMHGASPERATLLRREMHLLTRLRSFVPQAEVALPGAVTEFSEFDILFCLNATKLPREEAALAASEKTIVYANPNTDSDSPMMRRFTTRSRQQLPFPDLGPINEFVVAHRSVDIDLQRYPKLSLRCRNSPGALFHIRYHGLNDAGDKVAAWFESSPTDDRQTQGEWMEQQVDLALLARRGAGEAVGRLTRIEIILDDLEQNGDFTLDIDFLRIVGAQGQVGWQEEFDTVDGWQLGSTFGHRADAAGRYGFSPEAEEGTRFGHMTLTAISSNALVGPVDEATRIIHPGDEVRVLQHADFHGHTLPIVLQRNHNYLLNTYSPTEECWTAFLPQLLGRPLQQGVMFTSYSFGVRATGVTSLTGTRLTVIPEETLPVDRIRLVAPPELDQPLPITLPVGFLAGSCRVIRGERSSIPLPDPGSSPATITLRPGEVVEIERSP
ncbi:MAG: hypothetical protein ACC628_18150 [Pirellulaceae bacterium]